MTQVLEPLTNSEIAELERKLQSRLRGQVQSIWITRDGDGLVLNGNAATYYAKQLAQHYLMQGTSTPIRANRIEVSGVCSLAARNHCFMASDS